MELGHNLPRSRLQRNNVSLIGTWHWAASSQNSGPLSDASGTLALYCCLWNLKPQTTQRQNNTHLVQIAQWCVCLCCVECKICGDSKVLINATPTRWASMAAYSMVEMTTFKGAYCVLCANCAPSLYQNITPSPLHKLPCATRMHVANTCPYLTLTTTVATGHVNRMCRQISACSGGSHCPSGVLGAVE